MPQHLQTAEKHHKNMSDTVTSNNSDVDAIRNQVLITGIIYIIKNTVNPYVYVGQTTRTLLSRWDQHKTSANLLIREKNGENISKDTAKYRTVKNSPMYLNMAELGIDKFYIEEIDQATTKEQLNVLEKRYIMEYNCLHPNGFNQTTGGGSKYVICESTLNSSRDPILHDMPKHFTYISALNVIALQAHPLCRFKTFSIEKHGSVEATKEVAKKFAADLEAAGVKLPSKQESKNGVPKYVNVDKNHPGGYFVNRKIGDKQHFVRYFTGGTPEENLADASAFALDPEGFDKPVVRKKHVFKNPAPDFAEPTIRLTPSGDGYVVGGRSNGERYQQAFKAKSKSMEDKRRQAEAYSAKKKAEDNTQQNAAQRLNGGVPDAGNGTA